MTRPVTDIEKGHFDASLRAVRFVLGKRINIAAQISLANGKTRLEFMSSSAKFWWSIIVPNHFFFWINYVDILCIAVGLR